MSRKNRSALVVPIELLLFAGMFALFACSPPERHINHGMYYWKSADFEYSYRIDSTLNHLKVSKVFVKLFEVEMDSVLGPVPASVSEVGLWRLRSDEDVKKNIPARQVIPVVFIRNEVLKYKKLDVALLADQIVKFAYGKASTYWNRDVKFDELQIDCDWTESTAQRYHELIAAIKQKYQGKVSITLRLYPYKFPDKMGVPPADRAVLLCYNLLLPSQSGTKNSILDIDVLHDYLDGTDAYPLPLDVALPIYQMSYLFRNNAFEQTVDWHPKTSEIRYDSLGNGVFRIRENGWHKSTLYRVGDLIEVEEISTELLDEAVRLVKKEVELKDTATISFFHLDHDLIQQQGVSHLASIYQYWH
jgi:hypothetical protein